MELTKKPKLKEGFTTGTCATAAATASAKFVVEGIIPETITLTTPADKILVIDIIDCKDGYCGVIKDSGDDPDATNGMLIKAKTEVYSTNGEITFTAGEGVGIATLPGLKVPVGAPAINPVPKEMITQSVRKIIGDKGANITISVPNGEETAKKTFNPRLGVTGGISILGTTGIVKPMDEQSIFDSLTLELNTHASINRKIIAITFANTGEISLRKAFGIEKRVVIQTGNYIGYILDEAVRLKIPNALICGHPGKLLKVAAGTFNTHNRTGDGRKEALCTHCALAGIDKETIQALYNSSTTEVAMEIIKEKNLSFIWSNIANIIAKRCMDRAFNDINIEVAFIDNNGEILGQSTKADKFAEELRNEK